MPLIKRQPNIQTASRARTNQTTVETDVSSDNNDTDSDDGPNEGHHDLGPSDSVSTSGVPKNQAQVPPVSKGTNLPRRSRMDPQTPDWTNNSLGGRPLVHNNSMPYSSRPDRRRGHTRAYTPHYGLPPQIPLHTGPSYMGYPSNNVQYPTGPYMPDMGPSGASGGVQPGPYPYPPTNPDGYNPQQYPHPNQFNPWTNMGYPTTAQMGLGTPPPPATPKEDPEKVRLEAENAAYKAKEEKQRAAEKQRMVEAQIRREAEEAFHRRMEDMRIAQEEAKKEIERAKIEAEVAAKNRMQAEQDLEEERSERFRQFGEKLERDIRAKVELEKRAEMEEREAKAKQSEDLERLVKLEVRKSVDEIAVPIMKKVLRGVAIEREMSVRASGEQALFIEARREPERENNLSRDEDLGEKSRVPVAQLNIPPRHVKATTLRPVLSASVQRQDVSPTGDWEEHLPAVPDPPVLNYESDDEGTLGGAGTSTLDPSESGRRGRAHHRQRGIYNGQRHRGMYQKDRSQRNEALADQIVDAVVAKLIQSLYKENLIRHPLQRGQYHHQHLRPTRGPFDATPYGYPKDGEFDYEDTARCCHKDGYPGESSRRFRRPPKPAHLRGRSIRGSDRFSSLDMPSVTRPASPNGAPIAPSNSQASTPGHPRPPPVGVLLKNGGTQGRVGTASSYRRGLCNGCGSGQ